MFATSGDRGEEKWLGDCLPPNLLQSISRMSGLSKTRHCCMKGHAAVLFLSLGYTVFRDCRYSSTPDLGIFQILPMRNAFSSPECKSLYAVLRPIIKVSQSSSKVKSSVLMLFTIFLLLLTTHYRDVGPIMNELAKSFVCLGRGTGSFMRFKDSRNLCKSS